MDNLLYISVGGGTTMN